MNHIKVGNKKYIYNINKKIDRDHEKGNLGLDLKCEEVVRNLYKDKETNRYFMQCIACGHNFPTCVYALNSDSQKDIDKYVNEYMQYQVYHCIVI